MRKGFDTSDIPENYDPEPYYELLDLYFEKDRQTLVRHHIDSYNQFIEEVIPSIIKGPNVIYEKNLGSVILRNRLEFADPGIQPVLSDNDEDLMYPLDAMQKKASYSAMLTATITQWQDTIDLVTGEVTSQMVGEPAEDWPYAKIPLPVKCKYCNLVLHPTGENKHCKYDLGGYFIINGSEKVVVSVEMTILRKPLVFVKNEQNTLTYTVKVQSRPAHLYVGNSQAFTLKIKKDESIVLNVAYFKEVSVFTLMRALGLETDEDIVNAILDSNRENIMKNILFICMNNNASASMTRNEAMEVLINNINSSKDYSKVSAEVRLQQKRKYLQRILTKLILPHVTSGTDNEEVDMLYKAYYIGYMIHKLLKAYMKKDNEDPEDNGADDRDSLMNKRIELSGVLVGNLFEQYFKKLLHDCGKAFNTKSSDDRKPPKIIHLIKHNTIEQGIRQALSKGDFNNPSRKGLSQTLTRINYLNTLAYLRRVQAPSSSLATNKLMGPRRLHNTHYGTLDPVETPGGIKTGAIKNAALITNFSINMNSQMELILDYIHPRITPLENMNPREMHRQCRIFMNGNWIGICTTQEVYNIHAELRRMRFLGELHKYVSLVANYREREFQIYTDGGRMLRPFLTVTNNQLNFKPEMLKQVKSWNELLIKYPDVIEFVDKEEEINMMLAQFPHYLDYQRYTQNKPPLRSMSEIDMLNRTNRYDNNIFLKYTHCEIHPATILGIISSSIPFPNHNQSPRCIFQYSQCRHALGLFSSDYRERADISYILYHSQNPLVTSNMAKYTNSHVFPAGENMIVAIASYSGYNQEDSIVMNGSSIDMGLFRAQSIRRYIETIKKDTQSSKSGMFIKPDLSKVDNVRDFNYDKLTDEGYAKAETVVRNKDAIIGLVFPKITTNPKEKPYRDASQVYKSMIPGAIDRVFKGMNAEGYPMIKLRTRSERIPIIGDKFCSRAGQKGTMGYKMHRAYMPFSQSGLIPDAIINPNCIPKRMTIGQLIESAKSKICAYKGYYGDATAFMRVSYDQMYDEFMELGIEPWCNERLTNGMTGVYMTASIFIAPTFYQRLKQMSGDKIQSRSHGPVQSMSRQPTEGKVREGGIRFGEMERDGICAHGAAQFLKERMLDCSDIYTCHVCDICGIIAHRIPGQPATHGQSNYMCRHCRTKTRISKIVIPYVLKLFFQELQSINIQCRIRTTNSIQTDMRIGV